MKLNHAVVGSVLPPDTGTTTGSDCKLAAHLRSPGKPRLEKYRVSNSSLRLLCWQLSLSGRWNVVMRAVPCGDVLREGERVLHRAGRPQTGLKTVMPPKTRVKWGGIEPDVLFPSMPKFVSSSQFPTVKSVTGVMRHLTAAKVAHDEAVSTGGSSRPFFYFSNLTFDMP